MNSKVIFSIICGLFFVHTINAQQLNADSLFQVARAYAFAKQYEQARPLCSQILKASPAYHEVRILLGRTFAWDGDYSQALSHFDTVLQADARHAEAISAKANTLLWAAEYDQLLTFCEQKHPLYPEDQELLYLKALALQKQQKFAEATKAYQQLLGLNPAHEKALLALEQLKLQGLKNTLTVENHYTYFFGTLSSWNLSSLAYARQFKHGTLIGRVNYGRRFEMQDLQYEIDAYPVLSKSTYAYLNYGYAPGKTIFPIHRVGLEVFQALPFAMEASVGLRYLVFEEVKVPVYTGSLSKNFTNWLFSLRPFYTFNENNFSQSYQFISRRYLKSPQNFIGLQIGVGVSPDQAAVDYQILTEGSRAVGQYLIQLSYQDRLFSRWTYNLAAGYQYEENTFSRNPNRINAQFSLSYVF
jgi:YaiO family outer membrane protein